MIQFADFQIPLKIQLQRATSSILNHQHVCQQKQAILGSGQKKFWTLKFLFRQFFSPHTQAPGPKMVLTERMGSCEYMKYIFSWAYECINANHVINSSFWLQFQVHFEVAFFAKRTGLLLSSYFCPPCKTSQTLHSHLGNRTKEGIKCKEKKS